MKNKILSLLLIAAAVFAPVHDLDAKGFSRSSSSRSSFSRSSTPSRSFSSTPKPSTPSVAPKPSTPSVAPKPSTPSVAPKPSTSPGFSKTKPTATIPSTTTKPSVAPKPTAPKTAFDKSAAMRSITPVKPKDTFVNDFKRDNAAKYPTIFATQPATRPTYIPPVTTYNGSSRSVEYNPQTRSYGFFDDFGKFLVYDAITDIALDAFKKDEVRYVTAVQTVNAQEQAHNVAQAQKDEGWSIWKVLGVLILGGFLLFLVVGLISPSSY